MQKLRVALFFHEGSQNFSNLSYFYYGRYLNLLKLQDMIWWHDLFNFCLLNFEVRALPWNVRFSHISYFHNERYWNLLKLQDAVWWHDLFSFSVFWILKLEPYHGMSDFIIYHTFIMRDTERSFFFPFFSFFFSLISLFLLQECFSTVLFPTTVMFGFI